VETPLNQHEVGKWLFDPAVSLWAIRIAMAVLALGYTIQFRTGMRNSDLLAVLWSIGAAFATFHTLTALHAFHAGSLNEAIESTARRTEELFGVRVGWGVYVNYLFVALWWIDAFWRLRFRASNYRPIEIAIDLFLIAISFFGAVVFATGPIRYLGISAIMFWIWAYRTRTIIMNRQTTIST
jgi:hypothetical protein